jgi:hypothetical protein
MHTKKNRLFLDELEATCLLTNAREPMLLLHKTLLRPPTVHLNGMSLEHCERER